MWVELIHLISLALSSLLLAVCRNRFYGEQGDSRIEGAYVARAGSAYPDRQGPEQSRARAATSAFWGPIPRFES
jgi:hypothetical protein